MEDSITIISAVLSLFAVLLVAGAPIFAALGVASCLGIYMHGGFDGLMAVPDILHRGLASYSLIAIPLFILMGEVIARTDIGGRLYHLFNLWLNRVPGNLAVASIGSCALFGAMSGVSVAGAATIGRFSVPQMLKRGYAGSLAGGSVAAAGALALLIPPSIGFVLYGEMADQSIGKLFIAGIVPGILITVLMMLYVGVLATLRPDIAPRVDSVVTWRERFSALKGVWAAVLLVFLVLGTIYLGIATPTEAAGLGAAGAFLIAGLDRQLSLEKVLEIFRSTAVTSGMILLILTAALLFAYIVTRLMIPQALVMWIAQVDYPAWVILSLILLFLLVIGMFLDIVSIILIATPILLPVITALGFNPIWFGVIMIIACEMAVITPPVGLNLYVIKGVAPDLHINEIIWGALPFVVIEVIAIAILTLFPSLVLWLPSIM
jgi:tripartite ATP-independent transporter DctM subunit